MNRAREWIHCNEAYRRGLTGKGVGVAILDTGVFLHPDLENCVYGFRDFLKKKQQPYDDNGHGTHAARRRRDAIRVWRRGRSWSA